METRQHSQGQDKEIEEEEVVDPVPDPGQGEQGADGAQEVDDGLLALGVADALSCTGHGLAHVGQIGGDGVQLLLFLPGPALGLENFVHDLGSEEICQGEAQSRQCQEREEGHIHVPDDQEIQCENSESDGWVEVLVPSQDGVHEKDGLTPFLQARLDMTLFQYHFDLGDFLVQAEKFEIGWKITVKTY